MTNLSSQFHALSSRRNTRIFFQPSDDGPLNVDNWKSGIKALRDHDPAAACHAITHARGDVEAMSRRGTPRDNPLAKAILALKANPDAWSRLREATESRSFPMDPPVSDADWTPCHVNIIAFLWAANPSLLAQASKLWRMEREKDQKWWSCPLLGQNGYDGRTDLRHALSPALSRLFPAHPASLDEVHAPPPLHRPGEREAMADILTEAAKACILQLFPHERRASEHRAKGELVYSRGGSEWGLRWFGAGVNLATPPDSLTPTERAVCEIIAAAAKASPEQLDDTTRFCALALQSEPHELVRAAIHHWSILRANPTGLPFGRNDWIEHSRMSHVAQACGLTDEALGSWLYETGRFWSYPATPDYKQILMPSTPSWHGSHHSAKDSKDWTLLEWCIFSRPSAVRHACTLGARLADGFEQDFHRISAIHVSTASMAAAGNWIDACRLAEQIFTPAPSTAPRPTRL